MFLTKLFELFTISLDAPLSNKKKISSFGRTVAEILNFYSGKVTYGPPCISNGPVVLIHKEFKRDCKSIFCTVDAPLSNKKKISSFGQTVVEILNFYSGKVTYGPPCINDLRAI